MTLSSLLSGGSTDALSKLKGLQDFLVNGNDCLVKGIPDLQKLAWMFLDLVVQCFDKCLE